MAPSSEYTAYSANHSKELKRRSNVIGSEQLFTGCTDLLVPDIGYLRLNISTTVQTAAMGQIPRSIERILVICPIAIA